jgi:hypothetical protein
MRMTVIYLMVALVVWPPATVVVRRALGRTDHFEYVIGGLLAALVWPLTILALYISLVSRDSEPAVSAAPASVGLLPQGLPLENGGSDGTIRTLQNLRRNHPSASEGHVGRGRIAAPLLEASPRDHVGGAQGW